MYSHMMVGSNDIAKSKTFYDALFTANGGKPGITDPKGRLVYMNNGGIFLVTPPIDGQPAAPGNGMTIGFACSSPEQVKELHDVAIANGATSVEDPPGLRGGRALGDLHLCYFRDLDGHKVCGLHRVAK